MTEEQQYWTKRYENQSTGWDIGYPSTPIKEYIDQLVDKTISILIPGAGNAYEAEYIWKQGFKNVFVLDISNHPLQAFKERNPNFPSTQLIQEDFFKHSGTYDLILEQTFFCSLIPTDTNRNSYARHAAKLLRPYGKLVGVWFDFPLTDDFETRPFGGNKELYLSYLNLFFKTETFERCNNSITPRQGNELFGIFIKKID